MREEIRDRLPVLKQGEIVRQHRQTGEVRLTTQHTPESLALLTDPQWSEVAFWNPDAPFPRACYPIAHVRLILAVLEAEQAG